MNSFDDLVEMFKEKKGLSILLIVIYFIIIIVIVAYIWYPKNIEYPYSKYEIVDMKTANNIAVQSYVNTLSLIFKFDGVNNIKNKISESYIEYANCTKEDVINRLKNAGAFDIDAKISALNSYFYEDDVIYEVQLKSTKGEIKLNLIEDYPQSYKIALDNFYKAKKSNVVKSQYDISFSIKTTKHTLNTIEYEMSITNLKNEYVSIGFGVADLIGIKLSDGKMYFLTQTAEAASYLDIDKKTTINKTLVFEIPLPIQEKIISIEFIDIKIDGTQKDISVEI